VVSRLLVFLNLFFPVLPNHVQVVVVVDGGNETVAEEAEASIDDEAPLLDGDEQGHRYHLQQRFYVFEL